MKSFDLLSDLHADFWLKEYKRSKQLSIDLFVDDLLPARPSEVLLIAGDLGHHNHDSELLLKSFKRYYSYVLFVAGNHDYYLVNSQERWNNNDRSINRMMDLKKKIGEIEGVACLEGTTITINGVTYGGTGMWHDMSYGTSIGHSSTELYSLWERTMNDSLLILPVFTQDSLHRFFESEFEKLERILDQSQIVITHVGPDASNMPRKYQNDPVSSFFYFDGSSLLDRSYGKTWIFGHTHTHCDYVHDKGCRLINHSLGYPGENPKTKIRTVYL